MSKDVAFQAMHRLLAASRAPRSLLQTSFLCLQCRAQLRQPRRTQQQTSARSFSSIPTHLKKSSGSAKSNRKQPSLDSLKHDDATHVPDNKATRSRDAEIDPYDYSELEAGIAKAIARLKDSLVKTKDAGRVTPEMIEQLPVEINLKGVDTGRGSAHKEKAKIGELASVVAKGGRTVNVFCAEEAVSQPCNFCSKTYGANITLTSTSNL
jgi:hypothetical protein